MDTTNNFRDWLKLNQMVAISPQWELNLHQACLFDYLYDAAFHPDYKWLRTIKVQEDGKKVFSIAPDKLMGDLPIMGWTTNETVRRKFVELEKKGLIVRLGKENANKRLFTFTDKSHQWKHTRQEVACDNKFYALRKISEELTGNYFAGSFMNDLRSLNNQELEWHEVFRLTKNLIYYRDGETVDFAKYSAEMVLHNAKNNRLTLGEYLNKHNWRPKISWQFMKKVATKPT